jgi:hypothetical protein
MHEPKQPLDQVTLGKYCIAVPRFRIERNRTEATMRNFILGVTIGTILTAMVVQAAGKDGIGGSGRPPLLNDERERQFQFQLDRMRQQTELEHARMQGKKKPC